METPEETLVSIGKTLFDQVENLAQRLGISQNQLIEMALEQFVQQHSEIAPSTNRRINQGDVYWTQTENSGMAHPHVVVQDNLLNHSRISTVVVCALTSNTRKLNIPGNILLEVGEGNLTRPSVVEVSKVSSIAKAQLGEYIGSVSDARLQQILAGMRFVQMSFLGPDSTP